ncbi:MAG TPA: histidine--tRNA ligase [Parvularculaceae bacterium]|nr:histidine--tRNA ligase [Parvularculaceae bacterium]
MASKDKELRPKARIPRGFRDRLGPEIAAERDMLARISAVYERWGFDPLETPAFEYTDALGKFLPDDDRPNAGVFSLQDDDEQWMSLRYDLTAPLARYVAENYDALPKPFRRYQVGPVWRNEKPGPGRYRQFTQCDADTVGAPAPNADAEMCMMFADVIEAAGVARGEYIIRMCDRRLLDDLLNLIGLESNEAAERRRTVLRAMDKFERLGEGGVRLLLGPGRKDESGDFTKGAELGDGNIDRIIDFMQANEPTNAETCYRLKGIVGTSDNARWRVDTLEAITSQLSAVGYDEGRIKIDLSVVRGLEYYTGPVFEAEVLWTPRGEDGKPVRLGSVGGGGRYDGLVKRFKGVEVPSVGFSVGVSRLLAALEFKTDAFQAAPGPIVVLALEAGQMAEYQKMAAALRAAGLRAEVYLGGAGMKAQLKYADKRRAPIAVIQGSDERAKGEVTIKDLVLGAELSKNIEDNAEWRESQPAQVSVTREKLVAKVKEILARRRP